MIFEILGVPASFANAPGIETPESSRAPVVNGSPDMVPSRFMSTTDAHAALKALAAEDGWWALYDPTNPASVTLDGSGNVTAVADSLGNGPTLSLLTGQTAKPLTQLGSLRGVQSVYSGALSLSTNFAAVGVSKAVAGGSLVLGTHSGDLNFERAGAVTQSGGTVVAQSDLNNENYSLVNVVGPALAGDSLQATVWAFDTGSGDFHVGRHLVLPEGDPARESITMPNGILTGPGVGGVQGPLAITLGGVSDEARLRMTDMLTQLSGSPATVDTSDQLRVDSYADLDESGRLVAAYRPWKPVQVASVVKVMMAHVARKYVTDAMLDNLVSVVDPYLPTDNRYPSVYVGDTLSWRDLFTIVNHVSHNRLSSTLAYHAEKIRNPGVTGNTQQVIASFLAHVKSVANGYGWTETVFETPNGSESSIMSALHVAELFHKVRAEDPWMTAMMGTASAPFTINHVARAGEPAWVESDSVENIAQKSMGGYQFPELIGGKGGRLINPERNTMGTLWRNPADGQAHATMYVTGANGYYADRIAGTRRVWDAVRNVHDKPAHWSTPSSGSTVLWGHDGTDRFVSLATDPAVKNIDPVPRLVPLDPLLDPIPVVRKGDTVSFTVTGRNPYAGAAGSERVVWLDLIGGEFTNGSSGIGSRSAVDVATSWTTVTVSGTVSRGGLLTPSVFMEGAGRGQAYWVRNVSLSIVTPAGKTNVYQLDMADYSLDLDSQPIDPSTSSGSVGGFSATFERPELASVFSQYGSRYLYGKKCRLVTARGAYHGTVSNADLSDKHFVTVDGTLGLGSLNAYNVRAKPFVGTLGELIQTYVALVAESAPPVSIDPALASKQVVYPGWSGDLWPMLKDLCAAHDMQIVAQEDGSIRFSPTPVGEYDPTDYEGVREAGNPQTLARAVEVVKYDYRRIENELVYPPGGWSENVEVITVSPGETVEYDLELDASITSFETPQHVEFVDATQFTSSVYSIVDEEGRSVTPARWVREGGLVRFELAPDGRSIRLLITAPPRMLLDDINNAVRSYSFGSRFGDAASQYSTLRIRGTGVAVSSETLRVPTGVAKELTGSDVGLTVDNMFLSSMGQASLAGVRAALTYSGSRAEVQLDVQSDPGVGSLILGDRMDYRQRSSSITPAGVSVTADYYLTNDKHEAGFAGMTFDDVTDWYEGLSNADAQNRGRRTATTPWVGYSWLGTPDASASVKKIGGVEVARNINRDPRATDTANYFAAGSLSSSTAGGIECIAVTEDTAGTSLYADPAGGFPTAEHGFQVGDTVRITADVRSTSSSTMEMRMLGYDGAGVSYDSIERVVITEPDGWVRIETVARITSAPAASYFRIFAWSVGTSHTPPEGFYFKDFMIQKNTNEPYFDGSTQGHEQ